MTIFKNTISDEEVLTNFKNNGTRTISTQRLFLSLTIGFFIGFIMGYVLVILANSKNSDDIRESFRLPSLLMSATNQQNKIFDIQQQFINLTEHQHYEENTTMADKLYDEVKILCWVLTSPQNREVAVHIEPTWGRRCNKLIFISSEDDEELGAIGFNISEGREFLWQKTQAAFNYIGENYLNDYDWFLKADDDTYVIMENLRFMLSAHRSDSPIYFGSKFQIPSVTYMSGGAGYVLSREAVRRLVTIAFKNPQICRLGGSTEDVEIGVCLQAVGVIAGDSRDDEGKSRFHPLDLGYQLEPQVIAKDFWLWDYSYYKFGSGISYVSDKAISFHYLKPTHMYICEYLIYHVKPYGIWSYPENLPELQLTFDEEQKLLREAEIDRNLKIINENEV